MTRLIVEPTNDEKSVVRFQANWAPPAAALIRRFVAGTIAHASADQQWYWEKHWLAGEAEAQAEIDAGDLKFFEDGQSFLRSLD